MVDIRTGRPATLAPNGMVTSPHSLASQAGVDVLRAGGSAVDAAIATSAALSVLYPHMTGVGGDAFLLVHEAKTGAVRYIDGGGRATAAGTIDAFARRGLAEISYRGVLGGLNQSSQHGFCRSVPGIGQVLQRVFSSQASCVVGR
jgi:gamma-glutamyltranspeptidase/glutathione hydrolase